MTSFNFIPICHATALRHFGPLPNGSAVSLFNQFRSTAASSATSEYVTVSEQIGQIEELASRIEEQTGKNSSFAPKLFVNEAQFDCLCV